MAKKNAGNASRFYVDDVYDLVLVRPMDMNEAHIAPYNSVAPKWQGVRAMFLASHEVSERIKTKGCPLPTWRTQQEHFKLIVSKRREFVRKMKASSGISE